MEYSKNQNANKGNNFQKASVLMNLISSLEELNLELEKAKDSQDFSKFNNIKQDFLKINKEISKTIGELKKD